MLIELPSKEVKELFEGDFTQTSGRQGKDNHLPPPRLIFREHHYTAARLQRAPRTHTHAHTHTHTHARAWPQHRSPAELRAAPPRTVPRAPAAPVLRPARPGSAPAAMAGSGRQQHGSRPPSPQGGGPLCLAPLSILRSPAPAAALPEGRPPRPRRAARHRAAPRGTPRCRSGSARMLRPAPAVLTARSRGRGSRSGGPAPRSAPRAAPRASAGVETLPVLTPCLHDSQRLRDSIYDFQYAALHTPTPAVKAPLDVVFPAVSLTGIAASTAGEVIVLCVREERCHALGSEHSPRAAQGGTGSAG